VFGRQIDGKLDLWRMRADGTGERQITVTDDAPDCEQGLFKDQSLTGSARRATIGAWPR
jgi:hypothetical protein